MKTRPGTYDAAIVREMKVYDPLFEGYRRKKAVLDVGANIGAFARRACTIFGAEYVVAYEPDPENYALLVHNTFELPVHCVKAAITNFSDATIHLYLNSGMNKAIHSIIPTRGRSQMIPVAAISLKSVLLNEQPALIKIDIEGYEYELRILRRLPSFVCAVAVELHLNRKEWRERLAPELVRSLTDQFPQVRVKPKIGEKNWTTMFIGAR